MGLLFTTKKCQSGNSTILNNKDFNSNGRNVKHDIVVLGYVLDSNYSLETLAFSMDYNNFKVCCDAFRIVC